MLFRSRVFLHSEAHVLPEKECAIYLSPGTLDFSLEQQSVKPDSHGSVQGRTLEGQDEATIAPRKPQPCALSCPKDVPVEPLRPSFRV